MKKSIKELCRVIRSKNSGPYELTLDLIFNEREEYFQVKEGNLINKELVASLYKVPLTDVLVLVYFDAAQAIKATIKRPMVAGEIGETDVYGAQQHAPLLQITLDLP